MAQRRYYEFGRLLGATVLGKMHAALGCPGRVHGLTASFTATGVSFTAGMCLSDEGILIEEDTTTALVIPTEGLEKLYTAGYTHTLIEEEGGSPAVLELQTGHVDLGDLDDEFTPIAWLTIPANADLETDGDLWQQYPVRDAIRALSTGSACTVTGQRQEMAIVSDSAQSFVVLDDLPALYFNAAGLGEVDTFTFSYSFPGNGLPLQTFTLDIAEVSGGASFTVLLALVADGVDVASSGTVTVEASEHANVTLKVPEAVAYTGFVSLRVTLAIGVDAMVYLYGATASPLAP